MKFPLEGWKVSQKSDKGLDLFATKNISFDKEGYATLSPRTINMFDTTDDADFEIPYAAYFTASGLQKLITSDNNPFSIDINDESPSVSEDGLANQPSLSLDSSAVMFNNKWTVAEAADINTYNGSAWTDETPGTALTSGKRHPLAVNRAANTLLAGNGNKVQQYDTAFSVSGLAQLTIPSEMEVVGVAYNRSLCAVITWDVANGQAWMFVWDMATSAANYSYPMGSNRAHFVIGFKDTFITLTGIGELLGWGEGGLEHLAALPVFYTSAILADVNDTLAIAHDTSVVVAGDTVLFNISTEIASANEEPANYLQSMPSGVWCYDPDVGLSHRMALSGAKMVSKSLSESGITADVITVSATVPDTGTPVVYSAITGGISTLTAEGLYYTIKLSSTTFKLASTRANALAGTALTLTPAGGGGTLGFRFLPESDFGQLIMNYGGMLQATGPNGLTSLFSEYAMGAGGIYPRSVADDVDTMNTDLKVSENRGWIMTQKMFAPKITELWMKVYVKARGLKTEHDKVIVKHRVREDVNMPVYGVVDATKATWVDENTFTTLADLSAVKTAFDAGRKYEVEFVKGAASGYLAHISAIELSGGTYTVSIDEDIRNIAAADTSFYVINNWERLTPAEITSESDKDYTEFEIGKPSKWIQLKIELRGRGIAIEEYELINTPHKEN